MKKKHFFVCILFGRRASGDVFNVHFIKMYSNANRKSVTDMQIVDALFLDQFVKHVFRRMKFRSSLSYVHLSPNEIHEISKIYKWRIACEKPWKEFDFNFEIYYVLKFAKSQKKCYLEININFHKTHSRRRKLHTILNWIQIFMNFDKFHHWKKFARKLTN